MLIWNQQKVCLLGFVEIMLFTYKMNHPIVYAHKLFLSYFSFIQKDLMQIKEELADISTEVGKSTVRLKKYNHGFYLLGRNSLSRFLILLLLFRILFCKTCHKI